MDEQKQKEKNQPMMDEKYGWKHWKESAKTRPSRLAANAAVLLILQRILSSASSPRPPSLSLLCTIHITTSTSLLLYCCSLAPLECRFLFLLLSLQLFPYTYPLTTATRSLCALWGVLHPWWFFNSTNNNNNNKIVVGNLYLCCWRRWWWCCVSSSSAVAAVASV